MGNSWREFAIVGWVLLVVLLIFSLKVAGMVDERDAENEALRNEIVVLNEVNAMYEEIIFNMIQQTQLKEASKTIEVEATAYCSCPRCCGDWSDGITYTGTEATQGRTIAVDPDTIPLGSQVVIEGQTYIAEDIGGGIKGKRIDVYFEAHEDALEFGRKTIEVEVLQ